MKKVLCLFLGLFFVFFSGRAFAEKIMAEVGPYKLTESDLEKLIKEDPRVEEILKANPSLKAQIERGLIERWVNITLLYLAAKDNKIFEDPEVRWKLLETEKMILAEAYLQKSLPKIEVSEEEIKQYYETHKGEFKQPEGIKLKHILIYVPQNADNKTKERALNRAKQIRSQLAKGAKFEELARIHSDDTASREKGGDLGILRKGETLPEFEEKVFKLKPGEISQPILSPYGYHIVKVEKIIPEEILPFEKVKDQVKEEVKREKERAAMEELLKELAQKYQPKVYIENKNGER
ncbi:MAG: peptidylprolyl isomerase [Caldimicrobium thiodismutans]